MNTILQDFSEPALNQAIEANLFALFRSMLASWPRADYRETPEWMCGITDIPFPLFNSILNARLSGDTTINTIEEFKQRAKANAVPIMWWLGPSSRPLDLGEQLQARGFTHEDTVAGMSIILSEINGPAVTPQHMSIQHVTDPETLGIWSETCIAGFGMPDVSTEYADALLSTGLGSGSPIRHFLATLDDKPVATSSLFMGAGVAGIYNVATLQEARGRGVGAAVTYAALQSARADGYQVGILHATKMGYSVYRKLGFQERCKIGHYMWLPAE